jgi:hypothetical protein
MAAAAACNAAWGIDELTGPAEVASGGGGSGGGSSCEPGESESCYDGPGGTEGVGECRAGERFCVADGSAFGACEEQILPASESCAAPQDEDCDGYDCNDVMWALQFGSAGGEQVIGVASDAAGNVAAVGYYGNGTNFGDAQLAAVDGADAFVTMQSPDGEHLWTVPFGGDGIEAAIDVGIDPQGSVLVAGIFASAIQIGPMMYTSTGARDIFLVKLSPDGVVVWSQTFGDAGSDGCGGLDVDSSGQVALTGWFMGDIDFGSGTLNAGPGINAFVARFDSAGNVNAANVFGGGGDAFPRGVVAHDSGDISMVGHFQGDIALTQSHVSAGSNDIFAARLDENASLRWSVAFGNTGADRLIDVAEDAAENLVVVGNFELDLSLGSNISVTSAGDDDALLAKLGAGDGSTRWARGFGDASEQWAHSVAVDAGDNVHLTGHYQTSIDFGGGALGGDVLQRNLYVARLDADGNHVASRGFPLNGSQAPALLGFPGQRTIAVDPAGNVLLGGYFGPTITLGSDNAFSSLGAEDGFLTKLSH